MASLPKGRTTPGGLLLYFCKNFLAMAVDITKELPLTITPSAFKQLMQIREEQGIGDEYGLRVGVKGGGCAGFSYVLGFDVQKENDQVFEYQGLKIFIQKAHMLYLMGTRIDWAEGLNNRGFTFDNPNAKETCGCGTSFSA